MSRKIQITFENESTSVYGDAFMSTKTIQFHCTLLLYFICIVTCILFQAGTHFRDFPELKQTQEGNGKTQNSVTLFPSMRVLHMLYWFAHFLNMQPRKGISTGTEHGDRLN